MIATEPQTPLTLAQIAAQLDEHGAAITAARERIAMHERDAQERIAGAQREITEHEQAARDLIGLQSRLTRATFAGLFSEPEAPAKRGRSSNGASSADYAARMATRSRNQAIRKFAKERGLEVPEKGGDFSDELLAAFNQDGGYQG